MKLPYLSADPGRKRQQMIEFGGVNYGEGMKDGELAESLNLRSDLYPCMSPRRGQADLSTFDGADGILGGDDLFVAAGGKLYKNGEEFAALTPGEKTLLKMNTKLVVFPDKVYFNLNDEDNYELTRVEPSDWKENYTSYFTKEEEEYLPVVADSAPTWVAERYYRYVKLHPMGAKIELYGGTFAFERNKLKILENSGYGLVPGLLWTTKKIKGKGEEYLYIWNRTTFNVASGKTLFAGRAKTWSYRVKEGDILRYEMHADGTGMRPDFSPESYYLDGIFGTTPSIIEKTIDSYYHEDDDGDITAWAQWEVRNYDKVEYDYELKEGFADLFKPGDCVKISGCTRFKNNNLSLIVRDVIGNTLVFDDDIFTATDFELGTVTIEREVPDFDVVCEHNDRIWGAEGEKIYSSALGDPTNYNTFENLASDSYSVAVASDGKFTGCVGFSGSVLFFKEDLMYKILGDYPANYMMNEYNVAGVKKGSEKSLVNINERLFYHSNDGIYTYTGSVPTCVSYNFGTRRFENASAGGFATKYYISMLDTESGKYELFVYDTVRGIWLREEELEVKCFAEAAGKYMMLTGSGELRQAETADVPSSQEWSAELCEMTEYINERKCYSKLYMRLDLGNNARAKVEIRCDRGEWKNVWESTEGTGYTANVVFKPTRCDRFSIRLSGSGEVVIRSLIREYETGSEV